MAQVKKVYDRMIYIFNVIRKWTFFLDNAASS